MSLWHGNLSSTDSPGCLRRQVNMALTPARVSQMRARIEGGCPVIELSGNMFNDHQQLGCAAATESPPVTGRTLIAGKALLAGLDFQLRRINECPRHIKRTVRSAIHRAMTMYDALRGPCHAITNVSAQYNHPLVWAHPRLSFSRQNGPLVVL